MTFNIRQLDKIDSYSAEGESALEEYQDALLELFAISPEGQERRKADPEMGFWAAQLMHYGYGYIGVTIPKMMVSDVDEIVTSIFPRKISLFSPDDADDGIPELIAFWEFLRRKYKLRHATSILKFLNHIEPDFKRIMNDPANFGMAKSFFMQGQSAGFDMTDQEESHQFIAKYNANLLAQDTDLQQLPDRDEFLGLLSGSPASHGTKKARAKKKKMRKIAKASRQKKKKKKRR